MRGDFIRADAGYRLADEVQTGHFLELAKAGFDFVSEGQSLECGREKVGVERVLVAVPKVGRSTAGITVSMDVEIAKLVGVANQFRKRG